MMYCFEKWDIGVITTFKKTVIFLHTASINMYMIMYIILDTTFQMILWEHNIE